MPVQGTGASGTPNTFICNQQVGRYFDLKAPDGSMTQMPNPGDIGFTGYLYNLTTGAAVPTTKYILYYFVNTQTNGCATNVNNNAPYVGCKVTAGLPYHFTAYIKSGAVNAPALNNELQLIGTWTQQ